VDKSSRQEINNKETPHLTDIYSAFHPKAEYTDLSTHETFSRTDHRLGYENKSINLRRLNIFSNHNGMELEVIYKKKTGKFKNMWRLNNMLPNN